MNARVGELFQSKEFIEKIYPMGLEEVKQEIEANGGEITMDELKEISREVGRLVAKAKENGGELSEEDLVEVSGGAGFGKTFFYSLAGCTVGFVLGGYPGAVAGGFITASWA